VLNAGTATATVTGAAACSHGVGAQMLTVQAACAPGARCHFAANLTAAAHNETGALANNSSCNFCY
jgi:hypothetical protein